MSTRSKTRRASTSQASPTSPTVPKAESRSRRKTIDADAEKENATLPAAKTISKTTNKKTGKELTKEINCTCTKGDDGSPMVRCAVCRIWYHFTCVDLSEPEAEDISVFACPTCMESTGCHSIMNWEGPSALDGWHNGTQTTGSQSAPKRIKHLPEPRSETEESDEDPSSDDEYVAEQSKSKGRVKKRPSISSSDSDSDSANDGRPRRKRLHKASASPPPSSLKRKGTDASATQAPPSKRKKAASVIATDDPTRRYCLGKLEEILRDVFLRYPHVPTPKEEAIEENQDVKRIEKKLEEISDEEKAHILERANGFATELEQCIYDIYCEPDKQGEVHAGAKYKDRFRTLQFNLSKTDRVAIHKRIASGNISPKEISVMSSTDLADEETKQNIKIAEQEALEHSILQKSTVPRAKITHKGLQDIEDVNGELVALREREREREREQEEEERRERERMARVRLAQMQQRQRTASVSVPPESPVVPQKSPTWGAPPPVPAHAMTSGEEPQSPTVARPPPNPLFVHTASELSVPVPELNLADIINIEDEASGHDAATTEPLPVSPSSAASDVRAQIDIAEKHGEMAKQQSPLHAATGISPFAAKPSVPSFDLSSLWSGPSVEAAPSAPPAAAAATLSPKSPPPAAAEGHKDVIMESEISHATQDQDFDMFLEEKEEKEQPPPPPVPPQPTFEDLPRVWSGKISMPLDSTMQETVVVARQLGGRPINGTSLLWKTLFPAELLRIDGRVATENSCSFLTQTRLNPTKELIAVAFSPADAQNGQGLKVISDFLIGKNRHGLIFPWGMPPKDYSPGRELYVIPLRASDPLPECIELLDHLKLPKERINDYLIGVWVLYKGRLAPPPQIQPLPPPVQLLPLPPLTANITSTMFGSPPSAPPTSRIDTGALAKEVATLTPEQIQNVLRTLAATSQAPLPSQAPQLQPQAPGQPPPLHSLSLPPMSMLPQLPQPWATQPPAPYPTPYHAPMPMPPPPPPPFDRQDQRRDTKPPGPPGSDRSDRGDRRRRGRRRDGGSSPRRPVDSGWAQRKAWTEARGGGPSSPTRRW
ncbi:hypothetical protein AX15_003072 [Amanita polypyramis BW_CC]|nr:hypothetical protein AX15_003072 [Amanita polypyramis BW_CC]